VGYLHSSSWETRIAAAQTVEAILKQVPPWQPELQVVPKKERSSSDAATAAAAAEEDSCQSSGTRPRWFPTHIKISSQQRLLDCFRMTLVGLAARKLAQKKR